MLRPPVVKRLDEGPEAGAVAFMGRQIVRTFVMQPIMFVLQLIDQLSERAEFVLR
jgi:hypothetical protein